MEIGTEVFKKGFMPGGNRQKRKGKKNERLDWNKHIADFDFLPWICVGKT
jgi:hypothetical protein